MLFGQETIDLFSELQSSKDVDEIAAIVDRVTDSLGFTGFIFAHVNPGVELKVIDRRPMEWQDRFYRKGYAEKDPLIIESLGCMTPFKWSDKLKPSSFEQRRILAEASEFGLREGYFVPIRSATGEKSFLTYFSDRPNDVTEAIRGYERDLELFALMTYSAFVQKIDAPVSPITLTVREKECLLWAARGKTASETALIMGITDHTVKAHLMHAAQKLDATNKTQAVVKAIYLQLIAV